MKKNTTIEQAEKALKLVYNAGISAEGAFIFGDIAETWETASNTLRWWKKHTEYKITLNLITIYPGTYLYNFAYMKGLIKDKAQFLKDGCPQVNVSSLTSKQISLIVREIIESPMTLTKALLSIKAKIIDPKTGRVKITGICVVCGKKNQWENIKLFSSSFLTCRSCGQRYNLVLPEKFRKNIEKNIKQLLKKFNNLAVWGVNYHTADLFKKSEVLKRENVYPVEISEIKRKMNLYGKEINPPEVINTKKVEVVIVSIPAYISEIDRRIKANHKSVKKIIDICELVDSNYFNHCFGKQ